MEVFGSDGFPFQLGHFQLPAVRFDNSRVGTLPPSHSVTRSSGIDSFECT